MILRPHRVVRAVEDAPSRAGEGIEIAALGTVVWYVSGRGVCRPAVYHYDDVARVWVRGAACESVVDGGVFAQPTYGGRVEIRLVHFKLASVGAEGADEDAPWTVNYRFLPA